MKIVLALTSLNLRILLKDVLSLIWSLALPTIMLFLNKNNINLEYDLVLWFIFIYFNSFLYGVGIFALNQRDTGFLSTIYSIKKVPYEFFLSTVLTQLVFSGISCFIFKIITVYLFGMDFLLLSTIDIICLFNTLPIAFISYNLTLIRRIYSSTLSTICNICIFVFFIMTNFDTVINKLNPFFVISNNVYLLLNGHISINYLLISFILIVISFKSIISFHPMSYESR